MSLFPLLMQLQTIPSIPAQFIQSDPERDGPFCSWARREQDDALYCPTGQVIHYRRRVVPCGDIERQEVKDKKLAEMPTAQSLQHLWYSKPSYRGPLNINKVC